MKRVLIIGANSYLAKHLMKSLDCQFEFESISFRPNLKLEFQSILRAKINEFNPEIIINAGACQSTKDDISSLSELIDSNVTLPSTIASLIQEIDKSIVLVTFGTAWEYYQGERLPFNAYASSKSAGEIMLSHYALNGVKICYLRLFDVYGPNDDRPKIINLLLDSAINAKRLNMSGGEQVINLVHVDDIISGIFAAIKEVNSIKNELLSYSIGSAESYRLKDVADMIFKLLGKNAEDYINFGYYPYRERERFKAERFAFIPNWEPKVSLQEGLREIIELNTKDKI